MSRIRMMTVKATLTVEVVLRDVFSGEDMRLALLAEMHAAKGDFEMNISAPFDAPPAIQRELAALEPGTAAAVFAGSDGVTGLKACSVVLPEALVERGTEDSSPVPEGCGVPLASANEPQVPPYFKRETWTRAAFNAQVFEFSGALDKELLAATAAYLSGKPQPQPEGAVVHAALMA